MTIANGPPNLSIHVAIRIPARVAVAATDRSIPPIRMTNVPASASTVRKAIWLRMFCADVAVMKLSVRHWK